MVSIQGYGDAQIANAAVIADVAGSLGLGERGALLGVMCAMGESSLRNIDYGDWETNGVRNPDGTPTSSIGLFQQQAWWGSPAERMDPRYAAWAFFTALVNVRDWASLAPTIAIHRVQINADPNHYAKYETPARAVLAHIRDQRMRGAFMADPYDIIELPWQPGVYGRRALVDALDRAGRPWTNSVLRLKAEQQKAWDAYQNGTGSPADDPNRPDVFPLAHVRGIAADIDATAENVRRLSAVGLVRPYSYEPWHWQLPGNVRVWPLIDSIPTQSEEDDMYNDSDRKRDDLVAQQVNAIHQAIFLGGTSMKDAKRSISETLANIVGAVDRTEKKVGPVYDATFTGGTSMPDGGVSLGKSLADIAKAVGVKRNSKA